PFDPRQDEAPLQGARPGHGAPGSQTWRLPRARLGGRLHLDRERSLELSSTLRRSRGEALAGDPILPVQVDPPAPPPHRRVPLEPGAGVAPVPEESLEGDPLRPPSRGPPVRARPEQGRRPHERRRDPEGDRGTRPGEEPRRSGRGDAPPNFPRGPAPPQGERPHGGARARREARCPHREVVARPEQGGRARGASSRRSYRLELHPLAPEGPWRPAHLSELGSPPERGGGAGLRGTP